MYPCAKNSPNTITDKKTKLRTKYSHDQVVIINFEALKIENVINKNQSYNKTRKKCYQ